MREGTDWSWKDGSFLNLPSFPRVVLVNSKYQFTHRQIEDNDKPGRDMLNGCVQANAGFQN